MLELMRWSPGTQEMPEKRLCWSMIWSTREKKNVVMFVEKPFETPDKVSYNVCVTLHATFSS